MILCLWWNKACHFADQHVNHNLTQASTHREGKIQKHSTIVVRQRSCLENFSKFNKSLQWSAFIDKMQAEKPATHSLIVFIKGG